MHLFGGLNMGWNVDVYGEHTRQTRNASVHRDTTFVDELKDRLVATDGKRDRDVGKMLEMMQARDRKEEIAKAKAEGSKEAEARLRGQGSGAGMGWGNGMGGGGTIGGGGMGGGNGGMGFAAPTGSFPLNPFCPVHGNIYGRPCYHCQAQALIGNGRVAGYFSP
jgi:hypothetical protein